MRLSILCLDKQRDITEHVDRTFRSVYVYVSYINLNLLFDKYNLILEFLDACHESSGWYTPVYLGLTKNKHIIYTLELSSIFNIGVWKLFFKPSKRGFSISYDSPTSFCHVFSFFAVNTNVTNSYDYNIMGQCLTLFIVFILMLILIWNIHMFSWYHDDLWLRSYQDIGSCWCKIEGASAAVLWSLVWSGESLKIKYESGMKDDSKQHSSNVWQVQQE